MMKSISFYMVALMLLSLGIYPLRAQGQQFDFKVGSGQSSLEPERSVISLSLAGYGGPRDGRFTLLWERAGASAQRLDDMTGTDAGLFVLTEGAVKKIDPKTAAAVWSSSQGLEDLLLLTSDNKRLYGLTKRKEVLVASPKEKLRWKNIGFKVDVDAPVAFVKDGSKFFVADKNGGLWQATYTDRGSSWQKIGSRAGIIDLLVHSGRLYALTDSELLYLEPDGNWLRVAVKNDKNHPQDMKHVAVHEDFIYGIDSKGLYYRAGHYTEGNLMAGAVSINKGKARVLIVSLDVCGIDADFVDQVKSELSSVYHLPASAILINASHTHYAPVTQRWTTWGEHCQRPDSLYLYSTVKQGILDAVQVAVKGEKDANLFFGRDSVTIGRNRNLPGNDLPYDNSVDIIRIGYRNQLASDVLFLAGCHPVFNSKEMEFYKLSANYPGAAREFLINHSQIRRPIFLQGCGGDINPIDGDYTVTGRKLANAVNGILEGDNMQQVHGKLTYFMDTVSFRTKPWSKNDLLALKEEKEKLVGDIYAEERVRWANLMLSYYQKGTMPSEMPVYIQTLNIGNWKLVGISRETTTEYSLAIKKLWPDKLVSVAGYCNDVSSYLPTSRHIRAKIYEGDDSFFWYSQPSTFPEDVHEVIVESIRSKNR